MADVRRYTDQEIADAYTRFRMAIKGQQVNVYEYVAANDYDASAAELAEWKQADTDRCTELFFVRDEHGKSLMRIDALEAALRKIEKFSGDLSPNDDARQCGHYIASVAQVALNSSASEKINR